MKLLALIKKEFSRFFGDPKLLITMIMPGLLIYLIYTVMGSAIFGGEEQTDYAFKVYVSGESQAVTYIDAAVQESGYEAEYIYLPAEGVDEETARSEVQEGKAAALLAFSEGFDGAIADTGASDELSDGAAMGAPDDAPSAPPADTPPSE